MKITLIGGPANGQEVDVDNPVKRIIVPVEKENEIDANDYYMPVSWDKYGPVFARRIFYQAYYIVDGNVATYEVTE